MQGHTTAWQRLPGSGRRVKQSGAILRANEQILSKMLTSTSYLFTQTPYVSSSNKALSLSCVYKATLNLRHSYPLLLNG